MWWPFKRKNNIVEPEPEVQKPVEEPKIRTVNILSIDGGGIRGIIPSIALVELQKMLKATCPDKDLLDHFDIIAGTSTGGLISLALTSPKHYSPEDILTLYRTDSTRIFHSPHSIFDRIFNDKYDAQSFEYLLDELFEEQKMYETAKETMVLTYDLTANAVWPISTKANPAVLIKNAARATSAAPTYFPPVRIDGKTLVDGGVAANNPSLYAIIHARDLWPDVTKINVLSLSTATCRETFDYASGGLGWLDPSKGAPIQRLFTMGQMEATSDIVSRIPGVNYFRLGGSIQNHVKLDDASDQTLLYLYDEGQRILEENRKTLADFVVTICDSDKNHINII